MTLPVVLSLALLLLLLSAMFSGSETGFYCLSSLRVEADAVHGRRSGRLVRWLRRDEYTLLVTILVANNLVNQLLTILTETYVSRSGLVGAAWTEIAVTAGLTPVLFFAAELLPKELFRHRPHLLVGFFAPLIAATRVLLLPIVIPLRGLVHLAVRSMRVEESDLSRALGHESVVDLIAEGARAGRLEPHVERLALNVLALRKTSVERVMVPWGRVEALDTAQPDEDLRRRATHSRFSRLPVVGGDGVLGYVHQIDLLRAGPGARLQDHLRPLPALPPDLSLDRAILRLRRTGQRAALVGTGAAPRGFVTLKDLVETISGDLQV